MSAGGLHQPGTSGRPRYTRLKQTQMRGRILEISTPFPDRAMSFLKAAQRRGELPLDEVALYGAQIHAVLPAAEGYRGAIRQALEAADIPITSLEWIKPTLEDAFISIVSAQALK